MTTSQRPSHDCPSVKHEDARKHNINHILLNRSISNISPLDLYNNFNDDLMKH